MPSPATKVLLVEDHAILRAGLREILSEEKGLTVVGEAADGREGIRRAASLQPDLALMDISMPNMNGTEAIRQIKQRSPATKILILTIHKSEGYVRTSMAAGADGYVLKDDTKESLLAAIGHVLRGDTYLSPAVSGLLLGAYLQGETNLPSWERLTSRERQILKLIASGLKTREIAVNLSVSVKTVEKHRSNLMRKLDLHSISSLTTYAIQNGLLEGM